MKISVRTRDIRWTEELQSHVERTISFALDRYAQRIDRISLYVADLNGPRGGVDKLCQITADVKGTRPVAILERGYDLATMVNRAARRLRYHVGRNIERLHTPGARQYRMSIRAA
jgi:ribosome-associated translation inhibitor RaiA